MTDVKSSSHLTIKKIEDNVLNNTNQTKNDQDPGTSTPCSNYRTEERETTDSPVERPKMVGNRDCLNVSESARELSNWGLPSSILERYKEKGITTMFEWQVRKMLGPQVVTRYAGRR